MKNASSIILLFLTMLGCEDQNKPDVVHSIVQSDYYVELTSNDVELYYLNNGKLMSGYYEIELDNGSKEKLYVKNGAPEGVYTAYYPNGAIANTVAYKNGKKNGEGKYYYYKTGTLKKDVVYENNDPIKEIRYIENGIIDVSREKVNGSWRIKDYSEGKLFREAFNVTVNNKNLFAHKFYDDEGNYSKIVSFDLMHNGSIYLFDENLKIIDSINHTKEPQKLFELMNSLGFETSFDLHKK